MSSCPHLDNRPWLLPPVLFCLIGLISLTGIPLAPAQLPCVELGALSQSGGQAGSVFELHVVSGRHLEEIDQLRFSDPGITADVLTDEPLPRTDQRLPRYGHFRVRIPADLSAGRYEVRAIGRHGISNPRTFLVSSFEDAAPPNVSHHAGQPTPLPPNTRLHARATPAARDFYVVHLTAGQSLRIELSAQRVDSRMIGQLVLYDSDGHLLESARGADDVDPWLVVTAAKPRDYILGVRDFLFRGGDDYFYQLCVYDDTVDVDAPDATESGALQSDAQLPQWSHPSAVTLANRHHAPEILDPILETTRPRRLTAPCRVIASFDSRHDEDIFEFAAAKGDVLAVEIVSHRLGEPTDPQISIERRENSDAGDPLWHHVATQDDSQAIGDAALRLSTRDPAAVFEAPATATYRLRVRDLDSGESLATQQSYWLDIRHPVPDFVLLAYQPCPVSNAAQSRPVGSHLFRGGTEAIRVLAVRRDGWSGPIELSVEGLPDSIECRPAIIATNQSEAQLTLVAGEDAPAWCGPIRVVGRGVIDGQQHVHTATPAAILWGRGGNREFVRSRIATEIMLSVSGRDIVPLSIQLADAGVADVKKGQTLTLPIQLNRRDGGMGKCILRPRDLPPGVKSAEVTIEGDANQGQLELTVATDAAAGDYAFWLQAETTVTIQSNPQALHRAEQYRAHLQAQLDDSTQMENRQKIIAALKMADQRIEAAKPAAQNQQLTVLLPSPTVIIRIQDKPS